MTKLYQVINGKVDTFEAVCTCVGDIRIFADIIIKENGRNRS